MRIEIEHRFFSTCIISGAKTDYSQSTICNNYKTREKKIKASRLAGRIPPLLGMNFSCLLFQAKRVNQTAPTPSSMPPPPPTLKILAKIIAFSTFPLSISILRKASLPFLVFLEGFLVKTQLSGKYGYFICIQLFRETSEKKSKTAQVNSER